jgi:hypothetical protein
MLFFCVNGKGGKAGGDTPGIESCDFFSSLDSASLPSSSRGWEGAGIVPERRAHSSTTLEGSSFLTSFRRTVLFHRFLMALSVLPGSSLAISAHLSGNQASGFLVHVLV